MLVILFMYIKREKTAGTRELNSAQDAQDYFQQVLWKASEKGLLVGADFYLNLAFKAPAPVYDSW